MWGTELLGGGLCSLSVLCLFISIYLISIFVSLAVTVKIVIANEYIQYPREPEDHCSKLFMMLDKHPTIFTHD